LTDQVTTDKRKAQNTAELSLSQLDVVAGGAGSGGITDGTSNTLTCRKAGGTQEAAPIPDPSIIGVL
jgi:hypothetical protein